MIQTLAKMTRTEWIGQILLITLLRYKTTFYKVRQENNCAIVSSVAVVSRRVLLIFKPRKEHFFAEECFTVSICYLLDIWDRLARQFSLGKQAKSSKQLFKLLPLGAVHIDAFSNCSADNENAASKLVFSKSLFSPSKPVCYWSPQFPQSFLFYASSLKKVQDFRLL